MNRFQELWWQQVCAEHEILTLLVASSSIAICHQLHYLQMVTEKLGKAYYWRDRKPPPKSHASFVRFLQLLVSRGNRDCDRIATLLGFDSTIELRGWIRSAAPLAHEIERLAPALAGNMGPNVEYPWPQEAPTETPAKYLFPVGVRLRSKTGRQFLKVLALAVREFPNYA